MAENISKKIIEKIKKSEYSDEVKQFLRSLLVIELRNMETGDPRYSKEYERNIRNYVKRGNME